MEQLKYNYIEEQKTLEIPAFAINSRIRSQEPKTLGQFIKKRGFKSVIVPIFEVVLGGSVLLASILIVLNGLLGLGGY